MRLLALPVLLLLVALTAQGTEAARLPVKPIEAYIVVPAGETLTDAMVTEFRSWLAQTEAWHERESRKRIVVNLVRIIHPQVYDGGTFRPAAITDLSYQQDACGDGLDATLLMQAMGDAGVSWARNERLWFMVIGAGGWAGGTYVDQTDYGQVIMGDWGLVEATTGQHHPCSGSFTCVNDLSRCPRAFGHETAHGMGIDDPAHNLFLGDPWTRSMRRQWLEKNEAYY